MTFGDEPDWWLSQCEFENWQYLTRTSDHKKFVRDRAPKTEIYVSPDEDESLQRARSYCADLCAETRCWCLSPQFTMHPFVTKEIW